MVSGRKENCEFSCKNCVTKLKQFAVQELLPPQFESSDSSDESDVSEQFGLTFDDPWTLGEPVPEKTDMSDLWVTEDTMPLTERKRKYSVIRKK